MGDDLFHKMEENKESVRDVYSEWSEEEWWKEIQARRARWVEEGRHVEVAPCDSPIAKNPGAVPLGAENSDRDDGRVRVMFLHGLETSPLGIKPLYLAQTCRVCAPSLVPARPLLTLRRVCAALRAFRPHVVVGSSYGGAVLLALLQHGEWRGPALLLAPALGLLAPYSLWLPAPAARGPLVVVHGARDTVVPPAHSRALARSVPDTLVLDLTAPAPATDVLARVAAAHTALLVTADTHALPRLCAADAESPAVPTLRALVAALAARGGSEDPARWLPAQPSCGVLTALAVCASIAWQLPVHALALRCCPADDDSDGGGASTGTVGQLAKVRAEAAAIKDAEEKEGVLASKKDQ